MSLHKTPLYRNIQSTGVRLVPMF